MSTQKRLTALVDSHRTEDAVKATLMAIAAAAAIYVQSFRMLWVDEKITLAFVQRYGPLELLTRFPLIQPHLPTWYYLVEFLGATITTGLSIIAFTFTVLAAYHIATGYTTRSNATIAGFLTAVSPYLVVQATWLRMYGVLWCLLTWGLYWGLTKNYRKSTVVMVIAALVHPFGIFGPAWLGVVSLCRSDWSLRRLTVLALSAIPTLVFLFVNRAPSGGITGDSSGMTHGLQPEPLELVLLPVSSVTGGPQLGWHIGLVVALTAVLAIVVEYRQQWELVLWVLLPIAGITTASYFVHPVFRLKYFGMLAPAVIVLFISNLSTRRQLAVVGGGLGIAMYAGWFYTVIGSIVTRYYAL